MWHQDHDGPKYPFAIMNRHYIRMPYKESSFYEVGERAFELGLFKEDAVVIDVNCRKFAVIDVIKIRKTWGLLYLFPKIFVRDRHLKVKYVFGQPTQLTFDEARQEIVELVCSRKWFGQTGGTEIGWRQSRAECKDMHEFLTGEYGIGFYGRWVFDLPLIRRKKRLKQK
jgi:hypothetical protein